MRSWIVFATITILMAAHVAYADVKVTATVSPAVVAVGSEAALVITVQGKFRRSSEPELPPLDEFSVYQGGTSQRFTLVNGQQSASLEFTYVLIPKKEGKYRIEPIRFTNDGKVYTADAVTVEVVASSSQLPPPNASRSDNSAPSSEGTGSPIFIRAEADQDTVYVNQQITWTLGFYTDGTINLLRSPEYQPPPAEGFWMEDLPPQKNFYKIIDKHKYLVNEIKRGFFPTVPGHYKIGAARVDIVVDDFDRRRVDDVFKRRRSLFNFGETRTLSTDEMTIVVLPLPRDTQPANFSGLVGRNLKMSLLADKQVVQAGDPVNVTLEIRGQGNFKAMAAPNLPAIEGFKTYESGSSSDISKTDYIVTGTKRSDYVLIPKEEGEIEIPPVEMSYFDPVDKAYKALASKAIRMTVKPATEGGGGRQVVFTGSGEDIEVLDKDINFIRPVPARLAAKRTPLLSSGFFLALHAVPLLAVVASLAVERRRRRWRDNASLARSSRAAREAERKLKEALTLGKRTQHRESFAQISIALRSYIADKMNESASGLTDEGIDTFLATRNISDEPRTAMAELLKTCDGVQYAPVDVSQEQSSSTIQSAFDLIKLLERQL